MTSSFDRTLFTHGVVAVGVCIGAWVLLVRPHVRKLQAAQAMVVVQERSSQGVNQWDFEKAAQRMRSIKIRVAQIESCNSLMNDSSRLYGQIMDLAAAHHVLIQNLQPGAAKLSADAKCSVSRIDLTVDGSYEDVADFLDALDQIQGFIRPTSLSLSPIRDASQPGVVAHFSCDAISFQMPEALAAQGDEHVQP